MQLAAASAGGPVVAGKWSATCSNSANTHRPAARATVYFIYLKTLDFFCDDSCADKCL